MFFSLYYIYLFAFRRIAVCICPSDVASNYIQLIPDNRLWWKKYEESYNFGRLTRLWKPNSSSHVIGHWSLIDPMLPILLKKKSLTFLFVLKFHYVFNVNKLQETKSYLSLLMGSLQSHIHIDVLVIRNCFAKFEWVSKTFRHTKSGLLSVYIHYSLFEIRIRHIVGRVMKDVISLSANVNKEAGLNILMLFFFAHTLWIRQHFGKGVRH